MCLFTDASADHWSGMLTQVPRDQYQATTDVQQWLHEPLGFVGGTFRGSTRNWAIPDKEGYAIRESCAKFAHLLIRDGGFVIFTDHRNLVYIFYPRGRVPSMSKPQADRLERWALFLRCFDYEIFHVAGDRLRLT